MAIQALKGFKDILPGEAEKWVFMEETARRIFQTFGFSEIRTPVLEKTELFVRSIGAYTDIVEKEMYTFIDRSGDSITLRPEATASVLRAFIEHNLQTQQPVHKLFSIGPMFRHERPQKGRLRQFHQINAEYIGTASPYADAEIIYLLDPNPGSPGSSGDSPANQFPGLSGLPAFLFRGLPGFFGGTASRCSARIASAGWGPTPCGSLTARWNAARRS